jgi:hypothetical protein
MSLRRSPRLTPALLAANRLNAQKSTGPRSARGRDRAALNSLKHGLRSPWFEEILLKTGESPEKFGQAVQGLFGILKPRNRPEAVRAARYTKMVWAFRRRFARYRFQRTRRKELMELSQVERALQKLVMRDLERAWAAARYRDRRKSCPMIGLMKFLDLMAQSGGPKPQHDERSRNVL